ncbi:YitT family protein [Mediterraneibacter sp. NSJ-55]|uniref:YitT family protein n=2 Tax=Mediterraneibacter hominis TaxID=2763054 RepID=A0A923LEV9_9FIRM|nr:YitT family protein [Mediterraneibacter hominis]
MQRIGLNGMGYAVLGSVLFAFGLNVFITPLSLYNGGFMGISQLIRTFLLQVFHLSFGQTDIAGIIYLLINLPLIYLAWTMGKNFFVRSIITILIQTAALTLIPIPIHPVIEDYLTACIIGGIIAGTGSGLILRGGSSGGGQDILGLYFTKKFHSFSVGKMSLIINILVYGICLAMFNIEIVIYSLIYGVVYSIACDRVHIQNINMSVIIFTKKEGIPQAIMQQTGRGVTNWDGAGAYTNEHSSVLFVVISKHEVATIKRIVKEIDPNAFMVFNEGCSVSGNFIKRLDP